MKCRKTLIVFATISLLQVTANAQLKLPTINSTVKNDVAKVLAEYPAHFKNLAGEVLVDNPQATSYTSVIQVEGAEECTVTRYSSKSKDIYSWQALMLTTEDFETAQKKFKKLFSQVNNVPLKLEDKRTFHFTADYEAPAEERKFTSILFTAPEPEMKKLKLELSMRFEFPEWKVMLLVYEKEREDDESGRRDDTE